MDKNMEKLPACPHSPAGSGNKVRSIICCNKINDLLHTSAAARAVAASEQDMATEIGG